MLIKITDSSDCKQNKLLLKPEICECFNSYLRRKFFKFNLAGHFVKAKLPQSLESSFKTIKWVEEVLGTDINIINQKHKKPIAILYKIELVDVKL